jgi:tetratricopeptide (TPR) repeat protein
MSQQALPRIDPGVATSCERDSNRQRRDEACRRLEAHFNKVISLDPKAPDGYYGRGKALLGLGFIEHAIDDFGKVIEIDPGHAAAILDLAAAAASIGWDGHAMDSYRRALELDPANEVAKRGLAQLEMKYPSTESRR